MTRISFLAITSIAMLTGAFLLYGTASAAVPSVSFNNNTYYMVDGNNPALDTGDEVCASMKMKFAGYKSINTNAICKLFHPTAKELISVNGSKAGFYCNGAPQQGLACAKFKNTCQVCPACNLNEASTGNQSIGQHFKEMYVFCEPLPQEGSNSTKGPPRTPVASARASSSRGRIVSSSSRAPTDLVGRHPGYKVCEYFQSTNVGYPVRATKKLVSCGVPGLGDQFCRTALNNRAAKALKCEEHGIVICGLPCTTASARNEWFCSADINRPRGTMVKPLDFCPPLASSTPAGPKKAPGALCQHGGDCQSGWCLGVVPGREYRCSCIGSTTKWQSCSTTTPPPLPPTGRSAGQTCLHGGQCASGMCLGRVPGQDYVCSCIDPTTRWDSCRK